MLLKLHTQNLLGHPVLNEMYEMQDEIFEIQINENFYTNKKVQPIVYHENKSHQSVRLLRFSVPLSTKNRDRYRSIHHFSLGDAERKAQSLDISVLYRSFLTIIFHLLWIWGPYASCFIFRGSRIVHMH